MENLPEASFEKRTDLLLVTMHGKFTAKWFEDLLATIPAKAIESSARAVLIDTRGLSGEWGVFERYEAATNFSKYKVSIPLAFAANESLIDPERIGELVARNRGVNMRVFTDLVKAEAWLNTYTSAK